jgi:hypothetical protein
MEGNNPPKHLTLPFNPFSYLPEEPSRKERREYACLSLEGKGFEGSGRKVSYVK